MHKKIRAYFKLVPLGVIERHLLDGGICTLGAGKVEPAKDTVLRFRHELSFRKGNFVRQSRKKKASFSVYSSLLFWESLDNIVTSVTAV